MLCYPAGTPTSREQPKHRQGEAAGVRKTAPAGLGRLRHTISFPRSSKAASTTEQREVFQFVDDRPGCGVTYSCRTNSGTLFSARKQGWWGSMIAHSCWIIVYAHAEVGVEAGLSVHVAAFRIWAVDLRPNVAWGAERRRCDDRKSNDERTALPLVPAA